MCVAELASEFCKFTSKDDGGGSSKSISSKSSSSNSDKHCLSANKCLDEEMEPLSCRPKKCPFIDKRGCNVVSSCLTTEIITEYIKIVNPSYPNTNPNPNPNPNPTSMPKAPTKNAT
jgi:hypothetical protein